ncbi:hypothetical protein ILUMI_17414 [Ignelater luminosus]|uniref:Uncharacterized protein n=1 Tax=Ignelater luminosus TaxID=2038154 RepID=A0A8K0CJX1_IGNLU|nr:hypothetical protein ILUMI_17414 [Ignelater luminosus]
MAIDSEAEGNKDLPFTSTSPIRPSYASSDKVEKSATRDDLEDDVLDQDVSAPRPVTVSLLTKFVYGAKGAT